jgi:hypothetical protein
VGNTSLTTVLALLEVEDLGPLQAHRPVLRALATRSGVSPLPSPAVLPIASKVNLDGGFPPASSIVARSARSEVPAAPGSPTPSTTSSRSDSAARYGTRRTCAPHAEGATSPRGQESARPRSRRPSRLYIRPSSIRSRNSASSASSSRSSRGTAPTQAPLRLGRCRRSTRGFDVRLGSDLARDPA